MLLLSFSLLVLFIFTGGLAENNVFFATIPRVEMGNIGS